MNFACRVPSRCLWFVFLAALLVSNMGQVWSWGQTNPTHEDSNRRVLVLNAYHESFHWADRTMAGIHDYFRNRPDVELFIEYMDTKRHSSSDYYEHLQTLYRYKYKDIPIDAVLCCDENGLLFMLDYGKDVFPNIPVVFCGINHFEKFRSQVENQPLFTGLYETFDAPGNIQLILDQHPETENIAIVADASESAHSMLSLIKLAKPNFKHHLNFIELVNLTEQDMSDALKELPENTVILWTIHLRFKSGLPMTASNSIEWITNKSNLPIYCLWDVIGMGVIGGRISSPHYQGNQAASIVDTILAGAPPKSIQIVGSPTIYKFDWNQLLKWKLDENKLPTPYILDNRPSSVWEQYQNIILTTLLVLISLIILIVFLIHLNQKSLRAEAALRESNSILEDAVIHANESDRLKTEFLSNLSHEFRTPINGIMGLARIIKDEQISPTEIRSYADMIVQSSDQLTELIDDLLFISRIKSGTEQLVESEFPIKPMLDSLASTFKNQANAKDLEFHFEHHIPSEFEVIKTDKIKLKQSTKNLLKNAICFTTQGSVSLISKIEDDHLIIEVKDTGIGISLEKSKMIFDAFRTTQENPLTSVSGLGVGLYISSAFTELMGGSIHVKSKLAKGSVFTIQIPLSKIRPSE